jgi:nucleoside-diphosphate-sugar epimerase
MNELKNKTIVVTGGAGFIGSHLCGRLLEMGGRVICFDNLSTGKEVNIEHLKNNPDFIFIKGDANNLSDLTKLFSENKINYIFHYAAVLGVKRVEEDPLCVMPDLLGMEYILKLAKDNGVEKVMFSSSSEAYGDTAEMPLREDNGRDMVNNSINTHMYALVKLMGERIMKIYNDKYGLPTTSLRFFNVYGPRQESSAYGFVVGVFIKQILNNESPTIYGDGYQTRDFIYIDDNIRLSIKALLTPETNGEVINIGVGRQTTILDLAERLIRISGKNLSPVFIEQRKYEIKYRSPDITKMRKLLGEIIPERLDENLKTTFDSYLK